MSVSITWPACWFSKWPAGEQVSTFGSKPSGTWSAMGQEFLGRVQFLFVVLQGGDQPQEMESWQVRSCVGVSQLKDSPRHCLHCDEPESMDPSSCWAAQPVPWSASHLEETQPVGRWQHLLPFSSMYRLPGHSVQQI